MAVWSEVAVADLSPTFRFDAEYYQPAYLDNIDFLKFRCRYPVVALGTQIRSISGGATPLGADYPESGIPFLRVQNIQPGYLDLSDVVYIPESVHNGELQRSKLQSGDVLLTITGVSYGKAAYVPPTLGQANINQHSVRFQVSSNLLPEYVATFLNCSFGKLQSDMKITGITRPALDYGEVRSFLIPILPMSHQEEIRAILRAAEEQRALAEDLYAQAESTALGRLNIHTNAQSHQLTYERNFRFVAASGRFDAQYFHPDKEQVLDQLAMMVGEPVSYYFTSVNDLLVPPTNETGEIVSNFDLDAASRYFLYGSQTVATHNLLTFA
jgi:hypothetical protein